MLSFLHRESHSIIGAATIVGVLAFVSRFMGFIRDRILAGEFGAGDTLDVYYAAFKIPDLLFGLIVVGALSASFIPLFLSRNSDPQRDRGAWDFANNVVHIVAISMIALSVVLAIFAEPLSHFFAPGFPGYKLDQVVSFTRVVLIAQVLLAISMVYGSVLQSHKRFFLYSLAPIFYNLGIIIGAVWLVDLVGVIGLAWGVVLGSALHLITQILGVSKTGYRYKWKLNFGDRDTRTMFRLMGPRTLGIAIGQLLFLILSIFATTLESGSVTIFQFAYNIEFFAVGIFGVSLAIAVFPTLAQEAAHDNRDEFTRTLITTTRQIFYFLIPMTLLFLILRAQIVRVVVGAGEFDWNATILTADTLAFFALTLIPQSLVFVFSRAFYALKDTITPLTCAIVSALIGILTAFSLEDSFGVIALSIGYSLAAIIQCATMWVLLRQRMGSLRESELVPALLKMTTAGLVCGVVMQFVKPIIVSVIPLDTFLGVLSQGVAAGSLGICAYLFVGYLLGVEDQRELFSVFRRNFLRQSQPKEAVQS
jgi:putative peptidoglycan lipid II flippase